MTYETPEIIEIGQAEELVLNNFGIMLEFEGGRKQIEN